jgi:hypothetical protein
VAPSVVLPPEIQVIESPGGVRYRLPRRRTRRARLPGAICVATYLVSVILASAIAVGVARSFGGGALTTMALAFVLLATSPLLVKVLSLYIGRAEVELRGSEIRAIERVGPFRWSRRLPVIRVSRLVVGHLTPDAGADDESASVELANEPEPAAIVAEVEGGQPMTLAPGYPRAWLLALAQDLARRFEASTPDSLSDLLPPKIDVVESAVEAGGSLERPERPTGSAVVVERHRDGVTLIILPRGVGRGAGGCLLLFVSLLFLGGALLCLLGAAGIVPVHGDPWATFWICLISGLLPLLGAIEIGRRRAVLVVAGDTLRVTTAGPLGSRERLWRREELVDICTGPSGCEINDEPLPELQIHLMTRAKFGFLVGREADELTFLATELRRSLHLPAKGERPREL